MITYVAIIHKDILWALPAPHRHHHIIWEIAKTYCKPMDEDNEQGFLTDELCFLDRFQALEYALGRNQVKDPNNIRAGRLFSEDLW